MNPALPLPRPCRSLLALTLALAARAAADVTLTASSPAGATVIQPGQAFDLELTWSGSPPVAAADYAVTLNTNQLILTGRDFDPALAPYSDTPYLATAPLATNRVDVTWFKESGFLGKDVTLHFQVPANYTGPSTVTVFLTVDGAQDSSAAAIPVAAAGTSLNLYRVGGTDYTATYAADSNWSTLAWTPAGIPGVGDKAILNRTGGNLGIDQAVIIAHLDWISDTASITGTAGGSIAFDTADGTTSIVRIGRGSATGSSSGRAWLFDVPLVLNNDLQFNWYNPEKRGPRLGSVIGDGSNGPASLTIRYGPNGVNGGGTGDHRFDLGVAGGAPNTHSGGTTISTATAAPVLLAHMRKTDALGSGVLTLGANTNNTTVQLNGFRQTVRGVAGTTGASIASATAGAVFTIRPADGDSHSFAGKFSGPNLALTVEAPPGASGTGRQILAGGNDFTGPTTVAGARLLVDGSLSASPVTVAPGGTLGGSGTIGGSVNNQGTLAPGASAGILTAGAVTMGPGSKLEIEFAGWGGTAPGVAWDHLNCGSLALGGTLSDPVILRLVPLALADFAETAKTFRIASAATQIAGFAANAIAIDAAAMPGNGTWGVQTDLSGLHLELVYTPGGVPSAYEDWAVSEGLTEAERAPGSDADRDGFSNFEEFAFDGDPRDGSRGGRFFLRRADTPADPDTDEELTLTCAVRRGAVFSAGPGNSRVSAAIDGIVYTVEAGDDLVAPWDGVVADAGASDLPPPGSGLPDLTGSEWEYRTFSAFNGLPGKGFLRAAADSAP